MADTFQDNRADEVPDWVVDDFLERLRGGEDPSISEYAGRFPDIKGVIEEYLRHIRLMESFEHNRTPFPVVDGYEILCRIGAGSMGAVYAAEQRRLKRNVAIKILHQHRFEHFDRFCREAESVSRLIHPHIVSAYEFVEREGTAGLIMPLIYGLSLDRLITDPALSWISPSGVHKASRSGAQAWRDAQPAASLARAGGLNPASWWPEWAIDLPGRDFPRIALLAADVASALHHAHECGIVHRDVKPGNLLLDKTGKIWVLDFGLAHLTDASGTLSGSGDMIGTPRYMAPEQMRGVADARSDIYALGVTMWELATGQKAWCERKASKCTSSPAAMSLPRARDINEDVPLPMSDLIARCCHVDPAHRFQSARELEQQLRELATMLQPTHNAARRSALQSGLMFSLLSVLACSALQQLPDETRTPPMAARRPSGGALPPGVVYLETFTGNGDGAASAAGWNTTHALNDAVYDGRLYGGFNASENTTGTVAFVTTAHPQQQQAGIGQSPLRVEQTPTVSFQFTNNEFEFQNVKEIRLAIQVNGRWFASAKHARPDGSPRMSAFELQLDTAPDRWRHLRLGVQEASVGKPVTTPLRGLITGIGIVQTNEITDDNPIGAAVTSYDSVIIRSHDETVATN